MTPDQYIESIINKYIVDVSAVQTAGTQLYPIINSWAGMYLNSVNYSGSHVKGTAIRGKADADLFISLSSNVSEVYTLRELYNNLHTYFQGKGYITKMQNASIGITHNGLEIDLVPAVKHSGNTNDHWLYVRRSGAERIQTNVQIHIDTISNSGRIPEIRAIKVWAINHGLEFLSIYLELTVLKALYGLRVGNTASNVRTIMDPIICTKVID